MSARLAELPGDTRVWIFGAERPLTDAEAARLRQEAAAFTESWTAHGRPVVGAADLLYDRFLVVGADERATGVSGCSIDSLFRRLQQLERELELRLLDPAAVWFRGDDAEIRTASRPEFRERVRADEVGETTTVFDLTVTTLSDIREGRFELPLRESWHARVFRASTPR